mmetsp:Transcript_4956/g.7003  ORF Transcript_4956/g.7003 Transcript_4956/m.7003 type:complete len:84 (+) Transcript_4956:31-282(+)
MNPKVRDLYKKLLTVGHDYPLGYAQVRRKVKDAFLKNRNVQGEELKRAIHYGRYILNEMIGVIQLKKYRTLKRRYSQDESTTN